jgi:hypothetical protein
VYEETAMGIYSTSDVGGIQSYVATVPEPSYGIFALGLGVVAVVWRRKTKAGTGSSGGRQ